MGVCRPCRWLRGSDRIPQCLPFPVSPTSSRRLCCLPAVLGRRLSTSLLFAKYCLFAESSSRCSGLSKSSSLSPSGENSPVPLLENPTVNEIAQKHGKTSAQVLIRFHIQRGIATIPKSITPARIVENAEVYDFHLTHKEIQTLEGLNCNTRFIKWNLLGMETHKHFPFSDKKWEVSPGRSASQ